MILYSATLTCFCLMNALLPFFKQSVTDVLQTYFHLQCLAFCKITLDVNIAFKYNYSKELYCVTIFYLA